jgi:hypothetical protein
MPMCTSFLPRLHGESPTVTVAANGVERDSGFGQA